MKNLNDVLSLVNVVRDTIFGGVESRFVNKSLGAQLNIFESFFFRDRAIYVFC